MFNQLKKVLLGSMLVLMALVIGACSDDGNPDIPAYSPNFDLGADFKIDSLDEGKAFTQVDDNISNYSVRNILTENKNKDDIENQLQANIKFKLETLNTGSNVFVDDTVISSGSINPGDTLVATVQVMVTDKIIDSNTESNKYIFSITFGTGLIEWDGNTTTEINPVGDVYNISKASDLAWIALPATLTANDNFASKTVKFMNDVDMGGKAFNGIATLKGRLEGNHKKIYGLKIDKAGENNVGLIAMLGKGGSIDNLTIAIGGSIKGNEHVGAFVGRASSTGLKVTLTNLANHAKVTGTGEYVGGLVGRSNRLAIDNSSNTGDVKGGTGSAGGLVGGSYTSTISNSSNTGDVTGTGSEVGGLVGCGWGDPLIIDNSSNTGNVTGTGDSVGGLVGKSGVHEYVNASLTIDNSSNAGNVKGDRHVGGLVGFTGSNDSLTIDNSSNIGNVEGTGDNIGGLVGYSGYASYLKIGNSSNRGAVTGSINVGGIIGTSSDRYSLAILTNVLSYAKKVEGINKGGIVGSIMEGTVRANNVYWLRDEAVGIGSPHGIGEDALGIFSNTGSKSKSLTIKEFKTKTVDNFNTWDFEKVWEIKDGGEYPTLKNQPKLPVTP